MFNDLPQELRAEEIERNAYNAAFYELGLQWYWDGPTYNGLLRQQPETRIRHYLEACQPHLLKAYDAEFLARVIQERMFQHKQCAARPIDWAQMVGTQVGV